MNVYSELWELLRPTQAEGTQVCFGPLTGISPLEVTVGDTPIRQGLYYPMGTAYTKEQLGRELALLTVPDGFLILFQVEGGQGT